MPLKKKPIKKSSRRNRKSGIKGKKLKQKLHESNGFAIEGNETTLVPKATAKQRKAVTLINRLDYGKNAQRKHLKDRFTEINPKTNMETPEENQDDHVKAEDSMDIVIHIEIERMEMEPSSIEESAELHMASKYEECTPDCLPITPMTPPSPVANPRVGTGLSMMISRCLCQSAVSPVEHDPDVLAYFRERELRNRPKPNYLLQQPQIDRAARAFLINWLVNIVKERELDTETLYHAVSYIDRFLSVVVIQRSKLQIVGLACLHIALKFEVSRPPSITKLAATGNPDLDVKQIIQMEELILKALSFDLRLPTAFTFVNAFAAATKVPNILKYLAMYICELTLLEVEPYLQFLPSQVAAAAYALARYILGYDVWSQQLADVTNCRLENLKQIFVSLSKTHAGASKILTKAIQMKYLEKEYNEVALMSAVSVNEPFFDYLVEYYYSLGV